jgi:hypothetical protein
MLPSSKARNLGEPSVRGARAIGELMVTLGGSTSTPCQHPPPDVLTASVGDTFTVANTILGRAGEVVNCVTVRFVWLLVVEAERVCRYRVRLANASRTMTQPTVDL